MKDEVYFQIPEYNRIKLDKALDIVSRFMTSKKDDLTKYKLRILERILGFYCSSTHPEEVNEILKNHKNETGTCATKSISPDRFYDPIIEKYNIFTKECVLYSNIYLKDSVMGSEFEKLWMAVHEAHHTDTLLYAYIDLLTQTIYRGFSKIRICTLSRRKSAGISFDEVANELYTKIGMYLDYPEEFKNTKNINELIYSFPQNLGSLYYNELAYILKLLLLVCDNDLTVSYESLLNTDEPFVEKTVSLNGAKLYKNDFIYAGKHNCRRFEKHFDRLCNKKGLFEKMLVISDKLLEDINNNEPLAEETLKSFLQIIDLYKTRKYDLMEKQGLWDKEKRDYHERMYSSYREYISNIGYTLPRKHKEEIKRAVLKPKKEEKEKASN